jgi:F0F1-type ATP synthase delta subunit
LHDVLVDEFIGKLKDIRMDRINRDVSAIDVVTANPIDEERKNRLVSTIKERMGREPKVNYVTDPHIGGGVILKFGSMALDGSVKNLIRETAIEEQGAVEARYG